MGWTAPVTMALISVNLAVFLFLNILLGDYGYIDGNGRYLYTFGQVNAFILHGEALYQLFTSLFVHIHPLHIFMNMFALWYFGRYVEQSYNSLPFLLLYLASGVIGNILTLGLGPTIISAGASGSVFGVLGAYVILFRGDPKLYALSLLYALLVLIFSSGPKVNPAAHFGGFIVGLILGRLIITLKRRAVMKGSYDEGYEII